MAKQSTADLVATEITEWLEQMSDQVAEALLESPLAPQVVQPQPSHAELMAYYTSPRFVALLFNPDGSPNQAGRDSLIAQVGPDGYQNIALALADHHAKQADAAGAGTSPPGTASPAPTAAALLTPIRTPIPHPTNTTLTLGQLPTPTEVPALATPGGS